MTRAERELLMAIAGAVKASHQNLVPLIDAVENEPLPVTAPKKIKPAAQKVRSHK